MEKPSDLESFELDFLEGVVEERRASRLRHDRCPPPDLVVAAESEAMPEEMRNDLAEHLSRCSTCRRFQRDLFEAGLDGPTEEETARIRARVLHGTVRSPWRRPAALAALAASVALVLVAGRIFQRTAAPLLPPSLELHKPPVKLPSASALVWRGSAAEEDEYLTRLAAALEPYRRDDYAEAAARLEEVAAQYPESVSPVFYAGVSYLFVHRPRDAVRALEMARRRGGSSLTDDVTWYLALALYRDGRIEAAERELRSLCEGSSEYRSRACAALSE